MAAGLLVNVIVIGLLTVILCVISFSEASEARELARNHRKRLAEKDAA